MQMPARKYSATTSTNYRYGFNGKENDNEVKGEGNQQDYGMRIYDPRLGKFLSVDPMTQSYPWLTPYQFASNRPIDGIDLDGLEYLSINSSMYQMKTTEVCELSFTKDYQIIEQVRDIAEVAVLYHNIPQELRYSNMQELKFVSGGIMTAKGRDWDSNLDGAITYNKNRFNIQAQFNGSATDNPLRNRSFQEIESLRGNAIPGRSAGNGGGILGREGLPGLAQNWTNYGTNVALGVESQNRRFFYDATNIVDSYLSKNRIQDKNLIGIGGRNSLVNFLTDGTLPTDGLNTKNLSMGQLEYSLRVVYSGYQIIQQNNIGIQEGLADKVTSLYNEYVERGGTVQFGDMNKFSKNEKENDENK
jgi:RHS repeat-associated protein